jgi:hypothetical protein
MINKGIPEFKITKILNDVLDEEEIKEVVSKVKEDNPDTPEPLYDSKSKFELVKNLMEDGHKSPYIANVLSISDRNARYWMQKVKLNLTRVNIVDQAVEMLDNGSDIYDIAKRFARSPGSAKSMVKKAECTFSPVDDWIKKAALKGVLLSTMTNVLGIKKKEKAEEILLENFPGCFVVEIKLEEDLLFIPVKDLTGKYEWLYKSPEVKDFQFYVDEENKDYMMVKFNDDIPKIKVYFLSDIHVGANNFQRDRFIRDIKQIASEPNSYILLGGDMLEWIHKLCKADPDEQYESPNEQVAEFMSLIIPVKHRILGVIEGNHDGPHSKGRGSYVNVSLARIIAEMLQVPFFNMEIVVDLSVGSEVFTMMAEHGQGNGALKCGNNFRPQVGFFVHLKVLGHFHAATEDRRKVWVKNSGRGLELKESRTVVNGSYYNSRGGYAQKAKFTPRVLDMVFGIFNQDGSYSVGWLKE